jgi:hypothetical protein
MSLGLTTVYMGVSTLHNRIRHARITTVTREEAKKDLLKTIEEWLLEEVRESEKVWILLRKQLSLTTGCCRADLPICI